MGPRKQKNHVEGSKDKLVNLQPKIVKSSHFQKFWSVPSALVTQKMPVKSSEYSNETSFGTESDLDPHPVMMPMNALYKTKIHCHPGGTSTVDSVERWPVSYEPVLPS